MPFFGFTTEEILFRLFLGLAFCTVLAYVGYKKRALTISGAAVSWMVGMIIVILGGLPWLALILIFFVAGAAATRYKYKAKQNLGVAEERMGARSWQNVLANGISPVLFVVSEFLSPGAIFVVGYLGAVSTAMADTLSSEIGMTSQNKPRLITSLKRVNPGTHGGVSVLGTTASVVGCVLLGLFAWAMRMESKGWVLTTVLGYCILGGLVGGTVDSLLGAVFERRGKMSNSQVNLVSTIAGALAAIGLYLVL
jgi:uncharacterized protein (TIGR00297 family)